MANGVRWLGTELGRWLRPGWPWLRWLLLALALAVVVVILLWPLPALLTRHPSHGLTAAERLKATNDVRGTLVQALAGLALLGGLFFTARTFRLTREGQLTDRYTKAAEQLGDRKLLDVRLAGIYALERLMVDSPRDHPTIVEVLTAFLREHATEPTEATTTSDRLTFPRSGRGPIGKLKTGHFLSHQRRKKQLDKSRKFNPYVQRVPMPADIAAAARVIARRPPERDERGPLDLCDCYLSEADLSEANLVRAKLGGAKLVLADLFAAHLSEANLAVADLSGADLVGANLVGADLSFAHLSKAHLVGANLSGANLSNANLSGADLDGARLTGADLSFPSHRTDLTVGIGLTREQLNSAASADGATLPDYLAKDLS